MPIRLTSLALISAVVVAGSLAVYGLDRPTSATVVLPAAPPTPAMGGGGELSENVGGLPPNHPPIEGVGSLQGSLAPAAGDSPAIVWKMPDAWQQAPNPNAMRLATYRVAGGVEVTVSRAGGSTEANIQRWIAQFEDLGQDTRAERFVHGLQVVTVDIAGTYVGGGMTAGGPAEPKHDWAMVGGIVESRSPPYFFKMTGPAAAVRAARPAFDRFLESVAPTSSSP